MLDVLRSLRLAGHCCCLASIARQYSGSIVRLDYSCYSSCCSLSYFGIARPSTIAGQLLWNSFSFLSFILLTITDAAAAIVAVVAVVAQVSLISTNSKVHGWGYLAIAQHRHLFYWDDDAAKTGFWAFLRIDFISYSVVIHQFQLGRDSIAYFWSLGWCQQSEWTSLGCKP